MHGRQAVLAHLDLLQELAQRTRQSGETDQLAYFLGLPDALKKEPWLVLVEAGDGSGTLDGAVLLFEYRGPLGLRSRVFAGADMTGRRNVLALPDQRASVTARAAAHLMAGGAHIVHMAFDEGFVEALAPCWCEDGSLKPPALDQARAEAVFGKELAATPGRWAGTWSLGQAELEQYLRLETTYDATLAQIGQRTRSNLRYYRRRSEHDLGCHFVADVSIGLEDFLIYNQSCTYAVSDDAARRRYKTLGPGMFLYGIRDRQGKWLSLVGGRRQQGAVEIDWQMNRADQPHYSLATVVRSYLIEHEISLGTRRLYIEGSTPHPIARSFVKGRVWEATVKRRSLYARLLERFSSRIFPAKNYLAQVLRQKQLTWHDR